MIEIAPAETFNEDESSIVVVDDKEAVSENTKEPQMIASSSNSPPVEQQSNTESSARSSSVRDSPRIQLSQLSPGSPCTSSATSFSLPLSNRRSATPNSENEAGLLKLPESLGASSGLSPTSTSSSSFASLSKIDRHNSLQIGADESPASSRKLSQSAAEKRHICEICGKAFPYFSILESHKRCHTGERPFSCHYCDKAFSQKATLQVHERTHTGERPYQCKYCPKTFAQYGTKTVHEKSSHLGVRNYKCPVCSKCLSSPSALYTHKKTHGDKCFACPYCPKTFTLKNYLKLHVRQVHQQNDKRHVCSFCQKSFSYAGSLQVHLRTHTGERPYSCRFCEKAFASQGNLQSHERTHTNERPYSCSKCARSFIQKSQLTSHEATHLLPSNADPNSTDPNVLLSAESINAQLSSLAQASPPTLHDQSQQQKTNDFVCKFCGKRYAYASSLYVHVRLHTGERPFKCDFCEKSFTSQGNLIVHLRSHTKERPYKCEACHKAYAQKVGLKIHQEQCQSFLHRRGSVVTVGTNESDSSPSLVDADDYVVVDGDKEPNYFLNAPVKPQPIHLANHSTTPIFSPPGNNSRRDSFLSDVFFPGTPLLSPTIMQQQTQQMQFPDAAYQLQRLANLSGLPGLKMPCLNGLNGMQQQVTIPTSSTFESMARQNELLFSNALNNPVSSASTSSTNNNNYKDSLNNLLMEQQLIQNLQKLQQLLQSPPTPNPNNLLNGLLGMPLQSQPLDLLSQLQLGSGMNQTLNQMMQPAPIQPMTSNLSASLAAALNDLARQSNGNPVSSSAQMFIGGN